jgi:hypothetical protein
MALVAFLGVFLSKTRCRFVIKGRRLENGGIGLDKFAVYSMLL